MTVRTMIAGVRIESYPARLNEEAYVTVHKVGGADTSFLTPDEARRVADALRSAADRAEGKTP